MIKNLFSREIFSVKRTELNGFRNMRCLDLLAFGKIGNRSRNAQNTVIAACGKPETVEGFFQNIFCRRIHRAIFSNLLGGKMGVAIKLFFIDVSCLRKGSRAVDAFSECRRGFCFRFFFWRSNLLIRK